MSMEIGIKEGAIASILSIIKHILTSSKKSTIYFSWNLHSLKKNALICSVKVSNLGAV